MADTPRERDGMIDGEMFCAFIDILGFKSRVLAQDSLDTFRPDAAHVLRTFGQWLRQTAQRHPTVHVLLASDSAFLVASADAAREFLNALLHVQQQCFVTDIMTRGGVAFENIQMQGFEFAGPPNFTGKELYGVAVVEAVALERASKGMRLRLTEHAAQRLRAADPTRVVAIERSATTTHELKWFDAQNEGDYVRRLARYVQDVWRDQPREVVHYVETLRFIVRNTRDIWTLAESFDQFRGAQPGTPLLPPLVLDVWMEAFATAWELMQAGDRWALAFLNTSGPLVRELRDGCLGRDFLTRLRRAPTHIRQAILAVAEAP